MYHSTVNIKQPSHTLHRAPRNGFPPKRFASPGEAAIELVGAGAGSATVVADSIGAGATLGTTAGDGEVCSDVGGGGATGVGAGGVLLGGGCGVTLEGGWRAPSKEENCSGDRELGL